MYTLLPFLIMMGALVGIIVIVIRKFPQLTLLDVDNLPEVRTLKRKNEYLKKQADKKLEEYKKQKQLDWQPRVQKLKEVQLGFRKYVGQVERRIMNQALKKKTEATPEVKEQKKHEMRSLLQEAQSALEHNALETAESKFIAAIRIDPKEKEAYRGLGEVYFQQGQFTEAQQTFKYLLHLDLQDDTVLVKLAEIAEELGKIEEAVKYYQDAILINDNLPNRFVKLAELLERLEQYQPALEAVKQAVELEPQNPKYLDNMVELAIIVGNKELGEKGYQTLRMVNPENQKLAVLKEKISKL